MHRFEYTSRDRIVLWAVAAAGLVVNGLFVFTSLARPDVLAEARANPVALAFMIEACVLLAAQAYLLHRWGASRLHWAWLVVLAIVGSLAFALPVVLLWGNCNRPSH